MDIISPRDYISALADLNKRITKEKLYLKGNMDYNTNSIYLQNEIDSRFQKDLGFGINEISNRERLIQYENRISYEYSKVTNERLIKYSIEDEIKLFKNQVTSSLDYIKGFNLLIGQDKKDFFKDLGVNIPTAKSIIKNSSDVIIIPDKEEKLGENIFLKSNYKDYKVFIHLARDRKSEENLYVQTFLLFKKEYSFNYNPVRFFLNVLNDYGLLLRIGHKTKKFYREEKILPNHYTNVVELFEVITDNKRESHYITSSVRQAQLYFQMKFVYGINTSKYLNNLKRGKV